MRAIYSDQTNKILSEIDERIEGRMVQIIRSSVSHKEADKAIKNDIYYQMLQKSKAEFMMTQIPIALVCE